MQLAHTADNSLLAFVIGVHPKRRVLLGKARERLTTTDTRWGKHWHENGRGHRKIHQTVHSSPAVMRNLMRQEVERQNTQKGSPSFYLAELVISVAPTALFAFLGRNRQGHYGLRHEH